MSAAPPKVFRSPVLDYTAAGFKLCKVAPNSKSPTGFGWNKTPLPPDAVLADGEGLGLLLALCGLASFDIDDLERATTMLAAAGIDLPALLADPTNVHILSGKAGRDKLVFRMPMSLPVQTVQVRDKDGMIYELRCADTGGGSVQDVLPVATHCHPDTGKPYQWVGDYNAIPAIPDALMTHWLALNVQRNSSSGNAPVDPDPNITPEMVGDMLATQSADCDRETWRNYGMAVQQQLGDDGFQLWNEWSKLSVAKYPGEREAWVQYRSFRANKVDGITIATLIGAALKAGWIDPRVTAKVLEQFNAAQPPAPQQPEKKMKVNVNTLFSDMTLTSKEVEKMQSAKFIVPDLVVSGHVAAYISPGNGGKTTIFIHLCESMVEEGYTVTYLNLDGNPDDLKRHFAHAEHHGYKVISPDACEGGGMDQIMARFKALADSPDTDLNGYVFIIDTLKKVTDVINKSQAKEVYKIFRAMSVKGATVCLLAHANKYKDDAGGLVYEGTADLRNDVDELIYLNPFKDEGNNRLEVTTVPDKMRALVGKRSFLIDGKTRAVTELGYVIGTTSRESRQILDIARKAIEEAKGKLNQKQLVGIVGGESMHGGKKIRAALAHLSRDGGELVRERIEGKNEYEYSINPMFSNVVDLFTGKVSPIIESFNEKGEENE